MSSGPGEATLMTTVVSLDPMYAAFDVDEQSFLRYGALTSAGKRASARDNGLADPDGPRPASRTSRTAAR